jgi:DNA polymerase III epsilon subunit-like protein
MPLTVAVDTETTGLGHVHARPDGVVQVGLAWRDPSSGRVETWRAPCDPGAAFYADGRAAGAFRVNGMSPELVATFPPAARVAAMLRGRLRALEIRHGPLDLRAYNLDFDRPFLEAAPWSIPGPWGPCLLREAQARLGRRPRLVDALAAFGIDHPGEAHDAGADAHAALLLHEAMRQPQAVPATR